MGQRHTRLPGRAQAVLDDFRRGHITAGELSERLADNGTVSGPPPGPGGPSDVPDPPETSAPPRPRGRRGWLVPALVLLVAVGGIVGTAIGAGSVAGGPVAAKHTRVAPHHAGRHSSVGVATQQAQTQDQTSAVSYAVPVQTTADSTHTTQATQSTTSRSHSTTSAASGSQTITADSVSTTTSATSATTSAGTTSTASTATASTAAGSTTASSTTAPATTSSTTASDQATTGGSADAG